MSKTLFYCHGFDKYSKIVNFDFLLERLGAFPNISELFEFAMNSLQFIFINISLIWFHSKLAMQY